MATGIAGDLPQFKDNKAGALAQVVSFLTSDILPLCFQLFSLVFGYIRRKNYYRLRDKENTKEETTKDSLGNFARVSSNIRGTDMSDNVFAFFDPPIVTASHFGRDTSRSSQAVQRALKNYEAYYGKPAGSATVGEVEAAPGGIEEWSKEDVLDIMVDRSSKRTQILDEHKKQIGAINGSETDLTQSNNDSYLNLPPKTNPVPDSYHELLNQLKPNMAVTMNTNPNSRAVSARQSMHHPSSL